jgi:hypothetical protein
MEEGRGGGILLASLAASPALSVFLACLLSHSLVRSRSRALSRRSFSGDPIVFLCCIRAICAVRGVPAVELPVQALVSGGTVLVRWFRCSWSLAAVVLAWF